MSATDTHPRRFEMNKPADHVPGVQRYSARLAETTQQIQMLYLGVQSLEKNAAGLTDFLDQTKALFAGGHGPVHFDHAQLVDPHGYPTVFAVAYWMNPEAFEAWAASEPVRSWWRDPAKRSGSKGYFWEAMRVTRDHAETIAFKEYVAGLSACPAHSLYPMEESGYWGAARDRFPASAHDRLEGTTNGPITYTARPGTSGVEIVVAAPKNLCLIRSGVSWADCGREQLDSYNANIKPKLDTGMEHLRTNPVETGCLTLRQVEVLGADGRVAPEGYSMGLFQSFAHLEKWAHEHPTHLAIYARAMAERKKYQDRLELRTYHEIYVLNEATEFRYLNCHGMTGLLPVTFR